MIFVDETDNRYYVADSTIPQAGLGLFASENLKKGDWLEVIGVMVRGMADKVFTKYAERYKFQAADEVSRIVPLGWAGMVNHTDDSEAQNAELRCMKGLTKRNPNASSIIYYFIKDIPKGREILGNYGNEYGAAMKELIRDVQVVGDNEAEWKKFLSFDLYGLGRLVL